MGTILVIGSANTDLVIHADRLPKMGETLSGYDFQINAGGKGLNQAVAIAKLGGTVSFLGAVGNDTNGDKLVSTLTDSGVDFCGVRTDEATTGVAVITVVNGDNCIVLDGGANNCLTPTVIDRFASLIAESDYVVMQLEIPVESVKRVCEIAAEHNTAVVLNPAPFKPLPSELYPMITMMIPNEHEAAALTGVDIRTVDDAAEAIDILLARGVKRAIITLGENGCVYHDGNTVRHHPAHSTTVVDTTSAGDCFIGAVITKLAAGQPLANAIAFATKAAAITVSREGASRSIPTADEL